jgi:molecular chaperone GrpE
VTQLQAELAAANDRVLRAHAELENFRKRVYRQMDEERKYAALPLLRDLLPVVDNLDRAIGVGTSNGPGLLEGVKMVAQQLHSALERHHCQRLAAEGAVFDPHVHEALAQHPSDKHPAGTVMAVTQVGYLLHGRVVRPAQVLVSAGPATTAAPVTESAAQPPIPPDTSNEV